MKKNFFAFILFFAAPLLHAQDLYQEYIDKYADTAVNEMFRSGVPASITLAQGLLESGMGRSTLATRANNHFGIKCHDWTGQKIYHDDDAKNECFRKYRTVEESYQDHSDFLRYKDRYKFLFELDPTDYKGWCLGLKKAGYATDPNYANKLISIIEKYSLYEYDLISESDLAVVRPKSQIRLNSSSADRQSSVKTSKSAKTEESARKTVNVRAPRKERQIPQSPESIESLKPADGFTFSLSRKLYRCNDVLCIQACVEDTYFSIADEYRLFHKEILKYNDIDANRELLPGELVYLRNKKSKASKGLEKHICDKDGETLWGISQRYGVKLSSLLKYNAIEAADIDRQLSEGEVIRLRSKEAKQKE